MARVAENFSQPAAMKNWSAAALGKGRRAIFLTLPRPEQARSVGAVLSGVLNSSTRQPASDPIFQTVGPQNNRSAVAASCPHSISAKRLECCSDQLNSPPKADIYPRFSQIRPVQNKAAVRCTGPTSSPASAARKAIGGWASARRQTRGGRGLWPLVLLRRTTPHRPM